MSPLSPLSAIVSDNLKLVSDAATVRDVATAFASAQAADVNKPRPEWSAEIRPHKPRRAPGDRAATAPAIQARPAPAAVSGPPIFTTMKVGEIKRIAYRSDLIFYIATALAPWDGRWRATRNGPESWTVERVA